VCHLKKERDKRKEICFTGGMKATPKIPVFQTHNRSTAGSECKSRINSLGMLRAGNKDYVLNPTALNYMKTQKLPKVQMEQRPVVKKPSMK